MELLQHEWIYIRYYFLVQLGQLAPYWVLGIVLGSIISVFAKDTIHSRFAGLLDSKLGIWGVIPASVLGIASPLCMYGTIPLAASFSRQGMRDDWLAAFMMSSVLLNPQLILYSTALGPVALTVRILSSIFCGMIAGLLVHFCFSKKQFFNFNGFEPRASHDIDPNMFLRLLKNIGRNFKATGGYFLLGILLSSIFQRYVPSEAFADLFVNNEAFGVLMAATIGVPLYACGGGTIPLLQQWLVSGMSMGSAAAFMITGPATKITNLGAVKIVLGMKHFIFYLVYVMLFALITGLMVNLVI